MDQYDFLDKFEAHKQYLSLLIDRFEAEFPIESLDASQKRSIKEYFVKSTSRLIQAFTDPPAFNGTPASNTKIPSTSQDHTALFSVSSSETRSPPNQDSQSHAPGGRMSHPRRPSPYRRSSQDRTSSAVTFQPPSFSGAQNGLEDPYSFHQNSR